MAQVLIRDLDDETLKRLKRRADENHRSLQRELHLILSQAAARQGESGTRQPGKDAKRKRATNAPTGSVWNWLKRPSASKLSKVEIDSYIRAERGELGIFVTLFLDANVIIYLVEGTGGFRERITRKLASYGQQDESTRIAVSRLSWLECRVRPLRDRDRKVLAAYESFFSEPDLTVVELTPSVVETAAQIRAALNFSTPDALQAACALQIAGPLQILSNDRRFTRIPGTTVVAV